jgi:hypothetical protein
MVYHIEPLYVVNVYSLVRFIAVHSTSFRVGLVLVILNLSALLTKNELVYKLFHLFCIYYENELTHSLVMTETLWLSRLLLQ